MKNFLSTVALSFSFIMLCVASILGFRIWATLGRVLVVFFSTYAVGLLVSLVIAMIIMPTPKRKSVVKKATPDAAEPAAQPQGGHA